MTDLEIQMNAVERVTHYAAIHIEPSVTKGTCVHVLGIHWGTLGTGFTEILKMTSRSCK